jgi:hypothetical protein
LLAYETFAYLDVQKTGSSFIGRFLKQFSREKCLFDKKHGRVASRDNRISFYFISCRDPLDQFLSLYFFGCAGEGRTHRKLRNAGLTDFYDGSAAGFERWLSFILDPANAPVLGEGYAKSRMAPFAGFMTFRFVVLSIDEPIERLARCGSSTDLLGLYRTHNLAAAIVRFETIRESMRELAEGPLRTRLNNPEAAIAWLAASPPVNRSRRGDRDGTFAVSTAAKRLVEEREWFFFDVLGYPRYG